MTDRDYGEYGRCEATASTTGERCKQPAIGEHGKCYSHGGKSLKGADHPNFKHGKTSKYFKSKLSERQQEVYDEIAEALGDTEDAKTILSHVATRLVLLGESSNDPSMVREGRQLLSEFNIVDATDHVSVDAEVEQTTEHELDDDQMELARELIQMKQQQDAGGPDE